ncbi:hypothetical protein ALP29_200740 [Pseudomonas syringae pv. avii]|uniref:Uncharacterized protein n=1 Tax=Pseudomonas syringae pv. avii TaxID=663959 RepID=A0A3M5VKJ2_PSESX|nr:hypothetical protein ALP29_200740 [Pseudomonas syringae pv. avii]
MRFPAQEHHIVFAFHGAINLREHGRLAGFHHLEARIFEAEGVLVDHALDQAVAVVAGFDTVDLAAQFLLEFGDVGEVMQAFVVERLRHGQGVFGVFEVGAHGFDSAGFAIRLDVVFHGRHPVAEENVHVLAICQRLVGHRYGNHGGLGLVTQ